MEPAFPSSHNVRAGDIVTGGHAGMTLRDYFAAKAMHAIVAAARALAEDADSDDAAVATNSYRIADAMLAAREKK